MFCPLCGEPDTDQWDGLCKNCFLEKFKLIELVKKIELSICASCHAQLLGGKWKKQGLPEEEIIYQALENNLKISSSVEDPEIDLEITQMRGSQAECLIRVLGRVMGEEIIQEYRTTLHLNKTVCPNCSKLASGYYESVIQLRADSRALDPEEINQVDQIITENLINLQKKNRMAYLSQRVELKEGIDYYIGSQKVGRVLVKKIRELMGGLVKESARLMGRNKSTGKDIYRTWISLRLSKFRQNDFISFHNRYAQVKSLDSRKIALRDLLSQEKFTIQWKDYPDIKTVASINDVQKTTLTSKSPLKIQILHPSTFENLDIEMKPAFAELKIGDEVEVVDLEGKIYMIL